MASSKLKARLESSGVKVRCGTCGTESDWQRELRLPPRWSMTWVVVDERSWPKYECEDCKGKSRAEKPAKGSIEEWRERLESAAPKKRRKKR